MTFDAQYLQLPRQGRGSSLLMHFMILILDFTAFICLCVNLGLYHKWVLKNQDIKDDLTQPDYYGGDVYYQENTLIPAVRYWEDPVVLVVVLFSLIWTAFIYVRPAWTRKALHLGAKIAFEFLLFLIILACSIPAFIFSPLQPAKLNFSYQEVDVADGYCIYRPNRSVHYCGEDRMSLRKLQVAAYALVWAVA